MKKLFSLLMVIGILFGSGAALAGTNYHNQKQNPVVAEDEIFPPLGKEVASEDEISPPLGKEVV
jgi:hypothetical protein